MKMMACTFNNKLRAMTLAEMLVAMAILVIVMAAVFPQIRCIQNSWAYKQSNSESLQNGRVLIDHINANLSQATQITSVSASSADNGFIEYLDNDGNTMRYDIKANGYVEFGLPGSLSELAGPVAQLCFTCCDINDLPTTDPNRIRVVNITAAFSDAANPQRSKSFTTTAFIRTNASGEGGELGSPFIFDALSGKAPAIIGIDATHYLCVYEGSGSHGCAAVLRTDLITHAVTGLSSYQFDSSTGKTPALARIDATHYLCAYEGPSGDGWAVILQINPSTWAISKGTSFEYDATDGTEPALAQIDSTRYLCVYSGQAEKGYAVILTVNIGAGTITKGTAFKFDNQKGDSPSLAKIDATRYLCAYSGQGNNGSAAILAANIGAGTVSKSTSLTFEATQCRYPALTQIDATHYFCVYANSNNQGTAVIFTVGLSPAAIANSASYRFDTANGTYPSLIKIDGSRFLCAYQANNSLGQAAVLTVNTLAGSIASESKFKFDNSRCVTTALSAADSPWFLCAYQGSDNKGYSVMTNTALRVLP